jgi:hypothetical protein
MFGRPQVIEQSPLVVGEEVMLKFTARVEII